MRRPSPAGRAASAAGGPDGDRSPPCAVWGETTYHEDVENYWVALLWSIIPTIVVTGMFFFILRAIIRADRTERKTYAKIEAEERAKRGLPPVAEPSTER
jgi:hypothetical protein